MYPGPHPPETYAVFLRRRSTGSGSRPVTRLKFALTIVHSTQAAMA
jgi:hypothetical protein